MKKVLLSFIAVLLSCSVWAYDVEVDGIYYNLNNDTKEATVTYKTYSYNSYTGNVIIPSSMTYSDINYRVTSIGQSAFARCRDLGTVTIPNSVTNIGSSAFNSCINLTSIVIPNSVTSIGSSAFYNCTGLTSIEIPNSVTSIVGGAFYNCTGLTLVRITDIAAWCNIQFSDIYSNPLYYAHDLYLNDEKVTNLFIPEGVTSIGDYAFYDCTGLTSIEIPNSVTSIGNDAFQYCSGLTSVTIPNSVTSIGYGAFDGCSGLTSIEIPNSVTSIGSSAFRYCSGLTSIVIPNSVTSIGDWAFSGCTNLTSIEIPNSVTSIGSGAFSGCTSLTTIEIPNSVTSIGVFAFNNTAWYNYQSDGLIYAGKVAYNYKGTMPQNTSIIIKDGTTGISGGAFYDCTGLTSINIPNSVTSIGSYAFHGCTGLTSVTIGNSVTSIGDGAFYNCTGLTSIDIPNSVTSIGYYAFSECTGLTSIKVNWDNPLVIYVENVFYGVDKSTCTLYVPKGTSSMYNSATGWKDFTNIVEFKDDLYVDLELPSGLLWATCNIGAESPEQFGTYYDWNKNPVQENWDNLWRTPTKAERDELVNNCTYSIDNVNGVKGARYTAINGKSIFFPFAGYYQNGNGPLKVGEGGQYWTVTSYTDTAHWILATNYETQADDNAYYWPLYYFSFPVRPVMSKQTTDIQYENNKKEIIFHIYDINGVLLKTPRKGINIVKYSDGTIKKVMMR